MRSRCLSASRLSSAASCSVPDSGDSASRSADGTTTASSRMRESPSTACSASISQRAGEAVMRMRPVFAVAESALRPVSVVSIRPPNVDASGTSPRHVRCAVPTERSTGVTGQRCRSRPATNAGVAPVHSRRTALSASCSKLTCPEAATREPPEATSSLAMSIPARPTTTSADAAGNANAAHVSPDDSRRSIARGSPSGPVSRARTRRLPSPPATAGSHA